MDKALKLIWTMAGSFVALTLLAFLIIYFVGMQFLPAAFWLIPVFFLVQTGVLALIARNYSSKEKALSIGTILGVRVLFISLIVVFVILILLADREHVMPVTIISVVFALVFSFFETKILLMLNKKDEN